MREIVALKTAEFAKTGEDAYDNTMSQMKELIVQNYNHPSVFFWGISNEITLGGDSEELLQNLRDLHALAKTLDPSRLTTMAEVSTVPMNSEHCQITDILSYNHYFGWYCGTVADNAPWFDTFHAMHPDRAIGLMERLLERTMIIWNFRKDIIL